MADNDNKALLIQLTAEIVANYAANNKVAVAELPAIIKATHDALAGVGAAPAEAAGEQPVKLTAAQIRKSVTPDALVSFIDGKSYRTLRRHLTTHGLTPETYRAKYGLDHSYPMVAPSYSEARSAMAKSLGLGKGGRRGSRAPEPAPTPTKGKKKA